MLARIMLLLAVSIGAAGCASSGNKALKEETRESVAEKLYEGQPKEEVRALFGDPASTDYDGGQEKWRYFFSSSQANAANFIPYAGVLFGGATGTQKELVVLFDDDDRLAKYSMNESATETNTGIVQ